MIPAPKYEHLNAMLNSGSIGVGVNYVDGVPDGASMIGFVFFSQNYDRDAPKDFVKTSIY